MGWAGTFFPGTVGSKPIPCTCVIPKMSLKSRMPPNFDAYARSCRRHRPGVPCGRQVVPAIAVAVQGSTEEGRQDAIRLGDSFPQAVVAPLAAGACETKPHHAAPHSLLDLSIKRLKVEEEGLTLHLHRECGGTPTPNSRGFFGCAGSDGVVYIADGHDETKNALSFTGCLLADSLRRRASRRRLREKRERGVGSQN
uniref:Uncharacterized protein n=1 Tax=Oryza nivara TaxID=4536 RepID=A0A0E0JAL7_ORYNI